MNIVHLSYEYLLYSICLLCLLPGCEKEKLGALTGGADTWEEFDYTTATYEPDSIWVAGYQVIYRPKGHHYWDFQAHFIDQEGVPREQLSFLIDEPRLGCQSLERHTADMYGKGYIHRFARFTPLHGDAFAETYILFNHPDFANEICFTGISDDRKHFQGTFNLAFEHDTLGLPIYGGLRPDTFLLTSGQFQVSLSE
ncbi:hypothetical protein [Lewinella sp. JB7]|uniref:hypothetical protein n=1 Tax=Lewinella sp. JB7 TaxID=2962887 RepID=UPI0020CA1552|nr:hypothetical protein [Lewinella sp. JB7]MCP9236115.1 hypothetical protein [Lewinella sp. JB7]